MRTIMKSILLALGRCKYYAVTIFILYCISCFIGIVMVHNQNEFALSYRDKIVGHAIKNDKASIHAQRGNSVLAAVYDFSGNLFLGAVPQTLMGFSVVIPFVTVPIQGWVGGIVSVDYKHKSRFTNFRSTFYYFLVVLLQFIPYSLSIGAGVKAGIDFYNNNKNMGWSLRKYNIKKSSLIDLGFIYILSIPLFFIASCYEFMSTWNI
jgi:hypothetical protein